MVQLPIETIANAIQQITLYGFRLEYPGVFHTAQIDLSSNAQHIQLGLLPDSNPIAEIYWLNNQGYGRQLEAGEWFNIQGSPFPNFLSYTLDLIQSGDILEIEDEDGWTIHLNPTYCPPRDDPELFYHEILSGISCFNNPEFLERIITISRELNVSMIIKISGNSFLPYEVSVQASIPPYQSQSTARIKFDFEITSPISQHHLTPELIEEKPPIRSSALLYRLPSLGGWETKTHAVWAQRSLDLIEDEDEVKKYTEIYNSYWSSNSYKELTARGKEKKGPEEHAPCYPEEPQHDIHHPVVLGAFHEDSKQMPASYNTVFFADDSKFRINEDYYYPKNKYSRYYHHYGGEQTGLKYQLYFELHPDPGPPPRTKPNDRYYSARDWGYGGNRIDESLNRLTFSQAIQQYSQYSLEGKRRAYLMLGHVIHLLQDQGQPDHANLEAHAGSGMTQKQAYLEEYELLGVNYCEFLAATAAALSIGLCWIACSASVYAVTYWACESDLDDHIVGYERLVRQCHI